MILSIYIGHVQRSGFAMVAVTLTQICVFSMFLLQRLLQRPALMMESAAVLVPALVRTMPLCQLTRRPAVLLKRHAEMQMARAAALRLYPILSVATASCSMHRLAHHGVLARLAPFTSGWGYVRRTRN